MFPSHDLFRRIAVAVALMLGPGLLSAFGAIGHTPGRGSVTNAGSANYSIPLQVAPGPLGLQPKLSLDYSHGGGNGPLGVGWRIGGLSTITRVPSTIEQDGFARGVTLTSADALALDGRRLMKSGGYYYTEVDTLTRVEASGSGYVARFASGEVYTYSPVYSGSSALSWVVTRIEDRGGNAITINYVTESGVAVVSSITYGNGSISFSYESRTDKPVSYLCGHAVQLTKRVSLITVNSSTESMYSLTPSYSYSPESGRSVLTSLRDSRLDGSTSLVWPATSTGGSFPSSPPGGWTSRSGYAPQEDIAWGNQGSDGGVRFVDLNGDGYTDYVYSRSGVRKAYLNNKNGGWTSSSSYALPVDLYYEKPVSIRYSCWTEIPSIYLGAQLIDLTGDGLVDILYGRAGDRRAYINTGSGWRRDDDYAPRHDLVNIARDEENAVRIVDVDGDGLPDYIRGYSIYAETFSEQPVVYLNTGSGWSSSNSSSYLPKIPLVHYAYSKQRDNGVRFVDVNGDGLVDQLVGVNYNGRIRLEAYLNTGSGFSSSSSSTYAPPKPFIRNSSGSGYTDGGVQFVDLNGDGLLDMVVGFKSYWGGWFPGDYRTAYLNTGGGWSESSGYAPKDDLSYCDYNGETCDGGVRFEDVNGDGLPDYLVAMSSRLGSRRATYINTGSGWASSPASNYTSPYDFVGTWSSTDGIDLGVRFGDFNGDGRADIAKGFESTRAAYLNTAPPPELLKSVTDEFGLKREFEYHLLTNDDYHARATNSVTFPIVNYCAPMWIATAFAESNGIGGTHRTEYTYAYARVHMQGRGFLGFEIFESYDNTTGYSTTENVSQAFPWIGLVESSSITGGGLNRSVTNTLKARSTHTKVSFPYVGRSIVSDSRDGTTITTTDTYDDYGNLTQRIADYPGCPSVTTVNTFDNFSGNWVIGLLRSRTVTSDGQTTQMTRDYYSSGLLKTETEGIANPLTTAYARNGNGLVTSVTRSGAGMAARSETFSNFGAHGLPQTVTNAAGHVTTLAYDSRFGTVTSQTDPNGLVTTASFDALGRPTAEARPDGSTSTTTYSGAFNYGAKIVASTTRNSAPDEAVYTDMLDRVVAHTSIGGSGQTLLEQTTYRSDGLVSSKRALGLTSSDQYSYDGQQRVTSLTHANGLVTSYSYTSLGGQGMTTSITEAGQTRTEKRDARGQVTNVTTPEGATLVTSYNGLGYVTQTNASGAIATYTRDDRGLLTAQSDPDLGSWSYTNDATGQVVSQTDARGNVTTVTYDSLGRMTARTIAGETSTWAYDGTASGNKLGRLRLVTGPGGFRRAFYYDDKARPILEVAQIRGQFFNIATAYGDYSRVSRVEYRWRPLGLEGPDFYGNAKWYSFGVAYEYNADGFVTAVRDTAGRDWWTSPTYNDLGKVTAFTYGNGLATACEFDGNTGAMKSTQSSVQHLSFEYDTLGNLTRREDHLAAAVNTYGYDALNRLTSIAGPGAVTMEYDAQGNLTSRNGVAYSYTGGDSGGPHALRTAGGTAYRYDACGNVITRGSDSIEWTAFNRPSRMITGGATTDFEYDSDLQRVAEVGNNGVVKVFVAPGFEQYQRNGETETRIYLAAPSGTVGLRGFVEKTVPTIRPGGVVEAGRETIQYYHTDHLGSVLQTTGATGATAESYTFDGWGTRTTQTAAGDGALPADRGFTGHEELSGHRLVHMNARIYEPAIGRMLSPDTIIQAPRNPQNYNRYTYVANNPLSLTDPSGHMYGDPDLIDPDIAGGRGGSFLSKSTIQARPIQPQLIAGGITAPGSPPTSSGAASTDPQRELFRQIATDAFRNIAADGQQSDVLAAIQKANPTIIVQTGIHERKVDKNTGAVIETDILGDGAYYDRKNNSIVLTVGTATSTSGTFESQIVHEGVHVRDKQSGMNLDTNRIDSEVNAWERTVKYQEAHGGAWSWLKPLVNTNGTIDLVRLRSSLQNSSSYGNRGNYGITRTPINPQSFNLSDVYKP